MTPVRSVGRKLSCIAAVVGLQLAIGVVIAPVASAAVSPVRDPATNAVSSDALPTAQIDGVVWSQAVVGDIVYVGGQFAKARPAGAPAGSNTTTRTNLLSFNINTGVLTSFAPSINAQVKAVAASPDGSRIYVGGSFTSIGGQTRNRIAAFDANGNLVSDFAPKVNYTVNAIVATNTTVYAGGAFTSVGGQTRNRLAAFNASGGSLTAWTASADGTVNALAMTDGGKKIVAGGAFKNVGGASHYGMVALATSNADILPWAVANTVKDAGTNSAILSLKSAGSSVYGTGYVYGAGGNLEGTFKADGGTGNIQWIEDCHGDTYDSFPINGTVYTVSHAHFCGNLGGFPESNPRSTNMRRTLAFTDGTTGTIKKNTGGSSYFNWEGKPSPSLTNWFPTLQAGTYTGKTQAAWSVTGNSDYVVLGGEFPKVNGVGQQGLVRFAIKSKAPNKQGPKVAAADLTPTLTKVTGGVKVSWKAAFDNDDLNLTYKVMRNTSGTPVGTVKADSTFWTRPTLSYTDTTVASGTNYTYRIYAADPSGNQVIGSTASITSAGAAAKVAPLLAPEQDQAAVPADKPDDAAGVAAAKAAAPAAAGAQAGKVAADKLPAVQPAGEPAAGVAAVDPADPTADPADPAADPADPAAAPAHPAVAPAAGAKVDPVVPPAAPTK